MKAAGIYLRKLREAKYTNREKIAKVLKVDGTQIERVERGEAVRHPFLFEFINDVGADPGHVARLLLDPDEEDLTYVEHLAQHQLEVLNGKRIDPHRDERYKEVDTLIEFLVNHPRAFDKWLGYGECLLEQQSDSG